MDISLKLNSPRDVLKGLASRAKRRRLDANLTQEELANRAKVSWGTLKLFERTGKGSSEFLVKLAFALNAEKEFDSLFPPVPYQRIDDVLTRPKRVRARQK